MDDMYAVLIIADSNAEIIDRGYSSVDQLLSAWKDVDFINISPAHS